MSDPLAEHIYQAAFDRHVLIDRKDCAAIAAAARAFIGDEIAARGDADQGEFVFEYAEGYMYAFDIAEQIARGELT